MTNIYLVQPFDSFPHLFPQSLQTVLKISNALMEIIIDACIGFIAFKIGFTNKLALDTDQMKFIAGLAAIRLTSLSCTELNPDSFKSKLKETKIVDHVSFFASFIGVSLIAFFILDWGLGPSLPTGIALSIKSIAVVYAVMIEYGFNKTSFSKSILGACFVTDLGTVIGLGLIGIEKGRRVWS